MKKQLFNYTKNMTFSQYLLKKIKGENLLYNYFKLAYLIRDAAPFSLFSASLMTLSIMSGIFSKLFIIPML